MRTPKPNVADLPGMQPPGEANRSLGYLRHRGVADTEFLIAEGHGPEAAANAGAYVSDVLAAAGENRAETRQDPGGYMIDAYGVALVAADYHQTGNSRRTVFRTRIPESRFLGFLGDSLGIRQAMGRLASGGLQVMLHFGEAEQSGGTEVRFQTTERPPRTIAHVEVHEGHPFVNLRAQEPFGMFDSAAPFEGEGDIVEVPGAIYELMADLNAVTDLMIAEFSDKGGQH